MPHKSTLPIFLLLAASLLSACTGINAPTPSSSDPCIINPNLAGCTDPNFTTSVSIDTQTAPALTSNVFHDLLDITQIALTATLQSHTYKTEIQDIIDTQPTGFQQNCGTPPDNTLMDPTSDIASYLAANASACQIYGPHFTENCDNGNTYDIFIKKLAPGYPMKGTAIQVVFNNIINGSIDPNASCQIGNMYLSGTFYLAQIAINEDPATGNWTQTSELWPTVTVHDGNSWIDISNPMQIEASYTPASGLTFTGTVMDNAQFYATGTVINLNGMQFTHYPAGSDPNTSPATTYNNLRFDPVASAVTAQPSAVMVQMDTLDPATATSLSFSTTAVMSSNKTGIDLSIDISTTDNTSTPQPLIWDNAINLAPPVSGSFTLHDIDTGSQAITTINAASAISDPGKLDIVITDNSIPASNPNHVTTQTSYWSILMKRL